MTSNEILIKDLMRITKVTQEKDIIPKIKRWLREIKEHEERVRVD